MPMDVTQCYMSEQLVIVPTSANNAWFRVNENGPPPPKYNGYGGVRVDLSDAKNTVVVTLLGLV